MTKLTRNLKFAGKTGLLTAEENNEDRGVFVT
jgi:hypothetical protein